MAFPADSMWCRCGGVGSHRRRPWCESAHVIVAMVSIILLMASQRADGFRMGSAQVLPDRVNAEAKEGRQVYADTAAWSDTHQKLAGVQADFTSSELPTDNPLSPKEVSEDADQSDRHKTQQLARGRSDDLGEEDSQVVDDDLYPFINKKKATTFFWQQPSVSKRRQWFKKLQKMRDDDTFDDEDEDNGDDEHGDDSSLRDKLGLADKGDKGDDFDNTSDDGDNHSSESDDIESDEKDVDDEKTGSLEDEEDDESNDADEYHDEDYDAGSYDKDGDSEFDNDDHAVNDDDEERVGHYHESWSKYVDKGDQRTSSSDNKELTDSSSSSNSSKSKEDETGGSGSNSSSGIESDEVSYNISSSSSNNSSSDSSRVLYNDNDDASKQQLHKWNRRRWKGHSNTKQQMNAQQQPSKQRPTTHKHPQHIRKHPQSRVRLYRKKLQQQQRRRRRQHLRRWHHHHRRQIHRQRAATLGEERNGQPKSTEHKQEAATTDKPPAPSAHWLHRWQPGRKIHWGPSRRRQVARKAYSKCSERKPFPQKITGYGRDKIIMPRRRKKGSPPLKQKCNGKRRRNKAKGPKTAPKIPVVWNKGGTGHNTKNGTVVSQTGHENATLAYNASQKLPDSLMENNGTLPDTGFQGNASAALSSEHNDTGFHSDLLIANRSSDGLFPPKGEDSLGSLVPISTVYLGSVKGQKIHTARLDMFTHTSGSQASTSNETPLYLRVQYKSSKDGEPNSNSKEDIFPLLRAERKGPRDKIRKRQKREWKNPHEKSDSLEQSSASGSNRKPSTGDDDGSLSSKPDRLTLKYIVPIVQYIELMQAEANHKAPYLTDSEDDFPGASSSDNETSILRRNRRNIDDDGDDDNTDDDVDDVAGNNSDEMDNPVAAPGNDDDDDDDDDDDGDDEDDDDDNSRRVSNRRQWRRRHRISRALDDDDDDDDDDNDGDASSHRRSHGRRWLTHGRRHRENDDDNDDNDEDRSYSRHHGQQRYNNRRRSRGNNGDDNNDDDDNDNDDVRSSGSSSRRWHQSRPTHRRHSSNRNNDDDVNDDDNNDDDDVRRRQGRQNGRRRHYNDANDDDDDNDNNDDTETLRNVDRRNRYRHDQGRQGMRRHRNRNGDDNDDDNDDDDGDRRHRLRDRYRLRAQSSIPRSNNNDDNNNNDDDDNDRLRRYERRNMRQGRRIRTYDTMQADDGDVGDDNRGGSAVTSLGFVQINNDDEEGEQSQDTSLSHRHRAENTNSNRRRTEGRRNPRRERTQRRRENRMEQRRERGNGRRNRNRTTPLPIEVSIGDATKNADSRGGDITSNDRTAVDVRARTTAVVAASDDEVDAVRVSVRGGSDDGSPRSPPIPQIRAISNNNGNNGNGDGGTAPEAHIRSPFINHRTAYDFLSSQAVRPGQGRAGSRANNEQRAEQFQFAHTMSESLCEVFDKHFVPTAAGGRCE